MRRSDPRGDAALLAATSRDPEAFAVFYDRYSEPVFAFLLIRTRRADLAADLTAETFASALSAAGRFREDAPTAAPWLFQIARNKLLDSLRRRRVEDSARRALAMSPIELDDQALAELEERIDLQAYEQWLAEALAALPADQRTALVARVVDDRSYEEIAAEVDTSPSVIRKRVSRGLTSLRGRLPEGT